MAEDQIEHSQVEAEAPESAPEPPPPSWTPEDEEEAKFLGWKSPDEWVGEKPPGYIDDPKRYVERVANTKPFQALSKRLEETEKQYQDRLRKLESMSEAAMKRMKSDFEREKAEIAAKKLEAVQSADEDAYKALDEREKALSAPEPQVDPFVQDYASKNEWTQNPLLVKQAYEMIELNPDMRRRSAQDQFEYAEKNLRRMYPGMFSEPEKPKPAQSRVDGGGMVAGARTDPFTALPEDAKRQFRKFVDEGLFKDDAKGRKQYAEDYNAA
jgi:hypothetical protein